MWSIKNVNWSEVFFAALLIGAGAAFGMTYMPGFFGVTDPMGISLATILYVLSWGALVSLYIYARGFPLEKTPESNPIVIFVLFGGGFFAPVMAPTIYFLSVKRTKKLKS